MVVIYAEKPDMAEKIASALGGATFKKSDKRQGWYDVERDGKKYAVTWGYGHLCELADAKDYDPAFKNWRKMPSPFVPEEFKIVRNDGSKMPVKEALKVVKGLFAKADEGIVCATDYDREGELIFDYVYRYLRCSKPVTRVKLTSVTKSGIVSAFDSAFPRSDSADLIESARCRGIADWVVGCNLTVAMTVACGGRDLLSVGRVQTPTLAMIVARDAAIASFKPESYWTAKAAFVTKDGGKYEGTHAKKKFAKKEEADAVAKACAGKDGVVTKKTTTEKTRYAPNLYNLDSLQMDANSKYGFSLKRTLDATQKLYEKGYVTYPRTDSQFLPKDMRAPLEKTLETLRANGYARLFGAGYDPKELDRDAGRWFDDAKVGAHFAIVPTDQPPKDLSADEEKVFGLVAASVARLAYPPAVVENTKIVTEVGGEKFETSGTAVVEKGWMEAGWDVKETTLPYVKEGDVASAKVSIEEKKTEPPKPYTDKTLLAAMISAGKDLEDDELRAFMAKSDVDGIGTVATRASIIETLLRRGVARREGKTIRSTTKGAALVAAIPVEAVKSAEMTAKYERALNEIAKGRQDARAFLEGIYADVGKWCAAIRDDPEGRTKKAMTKANEIDAVCPRCGKPLVEFDWGYRCSGKDDGCAFSVGTICGVKLTPSQVAKLTRDGKTGTIDRFVSKKTGKRFSAALALAESEDEDRGYDVKFVFDDGKDDGPRRTSAKCPRCGKPLVERKWGYCCEGKDSDDGCAFSVGTICDVKIDERRLVELTEKKATGPIEGFVSKRTGKKFKASLKLERSDDEKRGWDVKLSFDDAKPAADLSAVKDLYVKCPACRANVVKGNRGWTCAAGCGVTVPYELLGRKIEPETAEALLAHGSTDILEGFTSKKTGREFNAGLRMEGKDVKFFFPEKE